MELFLFTTDLDLAVRAEKAGVDSIIVDWEHRDKEKRQRGYDTETNHDTAEDVCNLSKTLKIPIIVRINPLSEDTISEVELALDCGAGIIMLPMASSTDEVEEFLGVVDSRAKTCIQVETPSLVEQLRDFKRLPWDYAYIGLNDLMVASGKHSIWQSILDGTSEDICNALRGRRFGFGGATILSGGELIANTLILHEVIRLGGSISVLRRTFKKELLDRNFSAEMDALRRFIHCSELRGEQAKRHDHEHLLRVIRKNVETGG